MAAAGSAEASAKPTHSSGQDSRGLLREDCQYELHGVLVHSGNARGGHYMSFIKPRQGTRHFSYGVLARCRVLRCKVATMSYFPSYAGDNSPGTGSGLDWIRRRLEAYEHRMGADRSRPEDPCVGVLKETLETHTARGVSTTSAQPLSSPPEEYPTWWLFNDEYVSPVLIDEKKKKDLWFGQSEADLIAREAGAKVHLSVTTAYMLFEERIVTDKTIADPLVHENCSDHDERGASASTLVEKPESVSQNVPQVGLLVPRNVSLEVESAPGDPSSLPGTSLSSFLDSDAIQRLVFRLARHIGAQETPCLGINDTTRVDALEMCGRIVLSSWVVSACTLPGPEESGDMRPLLSKHGLLGLVTSALELQSLEPNCTNALHVSSVHLSSVLSDVEALDLCERLLRIICFPGDDSAWLSGAVRDHAGDPVLMNSDCVAEASPLIIAAFRHGIRNTSCIESQQITPSPANILSVLFDCIVARVARIARPLLDTLNHSSDLSSDAQAATAVHCTTPASDGVAPTVDEFSIDSRSWKAIEKFCDLPIPVLSLRANIALGTSMYDPFGLRKEVFEDQGGSHSSVSSYPENPLLGGNLSLARKAVRALDLLFRSFMPIAAHLISNPDTSNGMPADSRIRSQRSCLVEVSFFLRFRMRMLVAMFTLLLSPDLLRLFGGVEAAWEFSYVFDAEKPLPRLACSGAYFNRGQVAPNRNKQPEPHKYPQLHTPRTSFCWFYLGR